MKLVTYTINQSDDRLGVLMDQGDKVLDVRAAHELSGASFDPAVISMLALIEGGDDALTLVRRLLDNFHDEAVLDTAAIKLRAPIPRPPQIRDCLCFEEHLLRAFAVLRKVKAQAEPDPEAALAEFERKGLFHIPEIWYQQPIYYKANRFSVIGTDEDVYWPDYAELMDYELEFGFFIGKPGRDISKETARDHIFGYSIFNDISARDAQTLEMPGGLGPAKSKDFDNGNVIGPCIVTADEIDPYNLTMIARINGEEWSRGSSSTIHWTFEDLIAHVSRSETIHPGEFFGSGTVGGGSGLEQERYLSPGDVIELEVEGIGILRNKIVKRS